MPMQRGILREEQSVTWLCTNFKTWPFYKATFQVKKTNKQKNIQDRHCWSHLTTCLMAVGGNELCNSIAHPLQLHSMQLAFKKNMRDIFKFVTNMGPVPQCLMSIGSVCPLICKQGQMFSYKLQIFNHLCID